MTSQTKPGAVTYLARVVTVEQHGDGTLGVYVKLDLVDELQDKTIKFCVAACLGPIYWVGRAVHIVLMPQNAALPEEGAHG